MEIKDKKVSKNLVLDHLSRLEPLISQPAEDGIIKETFLDESLLIVVAISRAPWYADIVDYLACKVFPMDTNYQGKKRHMSEDRKYFWDNPYIFRVCGDNLVRRYLTHDKVHFILTHHHSFEVGSHLDPLRIAHNVLQYGFY